MTAEVRVTGLTELRQALRAAGDGMPRALTAALKETADYAAPVARSKIRSRSGKFAASLKPYSRALRAGLRSTLKYAGVQEFGGAISHVGGHAHSQPHVIRIKGQRAAQTAVAESREESAQILLQKIRELATRVGWRA